MKHHLFSWLIITMLLACPVLVQAQDHSTTFRPRFMIGPTAGINFSSVTFQPTVRQGLKLGYDGGIVLRYDAVPYAGIWLEVDYSSRGWREVPEFYPDRYYDQTLTFVNIPFMTHFMIGKGPFKLTIEGGTHFGILLGESNQNNFPADGEPPLDRVYVRHHGVPVEHHFAWGIGGGAGAEYHFSHMIVGLRASYVYGLGELYNSNVSSVLLKSSEQIISAKAYVLFPF